MQTTDWYHPLNLAKYWRRMATLLRIDAAECDDKALKLEEEAARLTSLPPTPAEQLHDYVEEKIVGGLD